MLKSELLPIKMEEEALNEALRAVANPHSMFFQRAISLTLDGINHMGAMAWFDSSG